jgi:serine/threonine protein phosphatase PrpC
MPQAHVDALIDEANRHGGLDNITAILVRIDSLDAEPPSETTLPSVPRPT